MKFKIVHSSEIDSFKWNSRIESQNSEIYNEYHYLSACTLDNWYGFVWGDYDWVLPFYQKKKWGIIPYVCMPPFCQKFDTSHLDEEMQRAVMQYFKKTFWLVDYQVSEKLVEENHHERKNYILSKNGKSNDYSPNYSSLLKKNIEKSKSSATKLDVWEDVLSFLGTNEIFKSHIGPKYERPFRRLMEDSRIEKMQYTVRLEGQIEAVLIAPIFRNHGYLLFPFSSKLGKKNQAMSILIHELIGDQALQTINFEGSSIPSIGSFYEQFGPDLEIYWSFNWEKYHFLRI